MEQLIAVLLEQEKSVVMEQLYMEMLLSLLLVKMDKMVYMLLEVQALNYGRGIDMVLLVVVVVQEMPNITL